MPYLSNTLKQSGNTELEQAIVRFVIGLLVAAYFVFGFEPKDAGDASPGLSIFVFLAFFFVASSTLVFANLLSSRVSPLRRGLGIALDMFNISYCLYLGGEQTAFVFCLYLWVVVGNGLRFGKPYLWSAMSAALAGFSAVLYSTQYWQQNFSASIGVYFLIVALPLYFSKLLNRLQHVNEELERRVEQRTEELAVEKNNALASSRAKSQFLANMSHELRTPLNAIIGYSEMLVEDATAQNQNEAIDDLKRINAAGQHLLSMIGDILDLSRIEAGKLHFQPQRFKLAPFLEEIVQCVSPMLSKTGNDIDVDPVPDNLELESDKTRLRQILLNLLGNAIKFTQNGSIYIGIQLTRPGWVTLQVEDTGIGIDSKHLQHIFEAFTQVDQSFTRHYGGSGLGLAICKRFCKMMGGDISVSSEPNKGSIFTVTLPTHWQGEAQGDGEALAS